MSMRNRNVAGDSCAEPVALSNRRHQLPPGMARTMLMKKRAQPTIVHNNFYDTGKEASIYSTTSQPASRRRRLRLSHPSPSPQRTAFCRPSFWLDCRVTLGLPNAYRICCCKLTNASRYIATWAVEGTERYNTCTIKHFRYRVSGMVARIAWSTPWPRCSMSRTPPEIDVNGCEIGDEVSCFSSLAK